jgi:hypothetical protein
MTLFLKARALRLTAEVVADKAASDPGGSGVSESSEVRADRLSTLGGSICLGWLTNPRRSRHEMSEAIKGNQQKRVNLSHMIWPSTRYYELAVLHNYDYPKRIQLESTDTCE